MKKVQTGKAGQQEAQQVFRQFAWLLAGTLAAQKSPRTRRKPTGR
ncbi:hypothetical protein [Pelagibacterium sediminicola]|nr:hypothetical protein [Pelagibacterium sediminicola]